jgi:hypothetical protein
MKRWTFKKAKELVESIQDFRLTKESKSSPFPYTVTVTNSVTFVRRNIVAATLDEAVGYAVLALKGCPADPETPSVTVGAACRWGEKVREEGSITLVWPPTPKTKTVTLSFHVPIGLDTPSETLAALKQVLLEAASCMLSDALPTEQETILLEAVLVEC